MRIMKVPKEPGTVFGSRLQQHWQMRCEGEIIAEPRKSYRHVKC